MIDTTPSLFDLPTRRDRATRLLRYMADVIVNGNALVKGHPVATRRDPAQAPIEKHTRPIPPGTRDRLKELGPYQSLLNGYASKRRCC